MPQPQYLSTDPNEGEPVRVQTRGQNLPAKPGYVSTDPNDGEPEAAPLGNPIARFGQGVAKTLLPSTVPADYIEGPKYSAQHPMDSIGLILRSLWDAHVGQAGQAVEAGGRVLSAPTLRGKALAASETLGHGLATVLPAVGPAAANAGEQIGSGDIAGGLGAAAGILAPTVAKGSTRLTAPLREAAASKLHGSAVAGMEKAINPTRIDTKVQTQRIVPQMLERRVKSGNLQKLEELAETKSAQAGVKVDEALTPHKGTTSDTMALVDELEKAKEPYVGKTTTGDKVINDKQRVGAIQKLQDTLMEYGDDISVESMVQLRRNWDEIVNAGKGFTTPKAGVKAGAARSGRTVLRNELAKAVPNLDKVNAEYSFWQTLEDVTHASNQRKTGQKGNLVSAVAGGAGAIAAEIAMPGAGAVKGGLAAALGAKLFSSLRRFIDSPGWQMWSAVNKERLADALMAKDTAKIHGLISTGMAATTRGSRAAGRVQSGRPVPQAADVEPTRLEETARSLRRGTRQ